MPLKQFQDYCRLMAREYAGEIGGTGSTPISGIGIKLQAFPVPVGDRITVLVCTRPGTVQGTVRLTPGPKQ